MVVIGESSGMGSTTRYKSCESCGDPIIAIFLDDSLLRLNMAIENSANWTYTRLTKSFKGGGKSECRLVIENSNFK